MSDEGSRSKRDGSPGNPNESRTLDAPTTPLENPTAAGAGSQRGRMAPRVPGFELLERIGAGGMGEVWSAEQREGIHRRVAIKLIRPGMDSDKLLARFEAERQALALMDHPAIARVYGAGSSADGRPYIAMEMVTGVPIDSYCDRHRLDLRRRLELFLRVCDGVQHAHQKAIIHRDLKPTNILVTRGDGGPAPKIIDFGLAKALGHRLAEGTMFTRAGEVMGTPEFMSPEQADPRGEEVDTRSDVYSLGMVLYLLLVGALPFDRAVLRDAGIVEFQKLITTRDPPRPSQMVSRLGDTADPAAVNRGTNPSTLTAALRGDLDWIVMKALEKSPERRYASVETLAADIRRHLSDHAVEARPPSAVYRAGKFVRRHTLEVAAAAVVVLALVGGALLATVGLVRARAAQREASLQAESANRVTEYLVQLFEVADPSVAQGQAITAREILDRGRQQVAGLGAEPRIRGHLEHTMGRIYTNLGLYDDAGEMLEAAVRTLRDAGSRDTDAELAAALHDLGVLYDNQGRYGDAERVFRDKVALWDSGAVDDERELARTLNSLGIVLWNQGRYDEAEIDLTRSIDIRERVYGGDSREVAKALSNLGNLLYAQREYSRAEGLLTRALAIERGNLGPDHPDIAASLNNLGSLYQDLERYDDARRCIEEALAIWEKVLDENHPDIGIAVHNLGNLAQAQGDTAGSLPLYRRAREIWLASLGPDHRFLAINDHQEAAARLALGELDQAEALLRRSLATWERSVGPDHPAAVDSVELLARVLEESGRLDEAERQRRRAAGLRASSSDQDG